MKENINYIIRPMEKKDIDQVTQIEKELFSIPWSANSFLDACETEYNIYLVCVEDQEVIGYCGLWTVLGEGNITNMAINPKYQGQGYGKVLLQELEKKAFDKGVTIFFLEVRHSNEKAQKLYTSLGYKNIGIRRNFYERPTEDALIMSKGI